MVFIVHLVGVTADAGAGGVALLEVSTGPDPEMMAAETKPSDCVVGDLAEVVGHVPLLVR